MLLPLTVYLQAADVTISKHCDHQQHFNDFFIMEGDLVACNNINGVMESLGIECKPRHWTLFIDSLKTSLKDVVLHNGNNEPSLPVGYAPHMKETYENIEHMLQCIKYDEHQWQLCGDLKVIAIPGKRFPLDEERLATSSIIGAWDEKYSISTH